VGTTALDIPAPAPRAGRSARAAVLAALLVVVVPACGGAAEVDPDPRPTSGTSTVDITEAGLRDRLEELAEATGAAPPFRAVGSAGFDQAATLVVEHLERAGWRVAADPYDASGYVDPGGSALDVAGERFDADDVRPLVFSPAGEVSGPVVTVGGAPGPAERSGSGCRVADYGELPAGAVVLVPPGGCLRRDQVLAAQQAGAGAYVTYTPGAPSGMTLRPTLVDPGGLDIPGVWVSASAADALSAAARGGGAVSLVATGRTEPVSTRSVIAELPGARDDAVVMLGAHLDSVLDGPGINDDGSGVAALLELAAALAGGEHEATVRLAFWSGEELGLHGATRYVRTLSPADRDALLVYLNADMLASPNGFGGVYDDAGAPPGSGAVGDLLRAAVEESGGTPVSVDLTASSDHYPFALAGIPIGGVFSGAWEPVTPEQAAAAGARAGEPADACYHQPCDDLANLDLRLGRLLATALGDVAVRLADDPGLLAERSDPSDES
jgi:hypothetical protein